MRGWLWRCLQARSRHPKFTALHDFYGTDGASPPAHVLLNGKRDVGKGTIFRILP